MSPLLRAETLPPDFVIHPDHFEQADEPTDSCMAARDIVPVRTGWALLG